MLIMLTLALSLSLTIPEEVANYVALGDMRVPAKPRGRVEGIKRKGKE